MQLIIQSSNVELNAIAKQNIKKRARRIFSRIEDKVDSILINIQDINGPKGGLDKLCKVVIKSSIVPSVVVSNKKRQAAAAIDLALNKACFNLLKKIKKQSGKRNGDAVMNQIEI